MAPLQRRAHGAGGSSASSSAEAGDTVPPLAPPPPPLSMPPISRPISPGPQQLDIDVDGKNKLGLTRVESALSLADDDCCPTCLDGYSEENPKIMTQCDHHFHLGCIYEWMERSNHCPVCDKEMVFSESL